MLWRYRQAVDSTRETRKAWLTTLVGLGYFLVWTLFGMALYPLGVAVAAAEMQETVLARIAPVGIGAIVSIAGAIQFTSLKAHHLGCCRGEPGRSYSLPADAGTAWRHGLALGLHCVCCCANLTAVMVAIGVMDLRAMTLVTALISVERLAPGRNRVARAVGAVLVGVGVFLIVRAAGVE
jgi:predicted metal-binding membrane protein